MQRESPGVVRIELPEHGYVDLPIAGVGRRGYAALLDFAITLIFIAISLLALSLALGGATASSVPVLFSVAVASPVLVPLLMELVGQGQSPGKRLASLRVISQDGHPVAAWQLALRNVMRLVDFLPASYAFGLILLAFSPRTQRMGDLVAGTLVISESIDALAEYEPERPPQHLAGVPGPLLLALHTLSERRSDLEPEVFTRRRAALMTRFRELRPDWRILGDEALWNELNEYR